MGESTFAKRLHKHVLWDENATDAGGTANAAISAYAFRDEDGCRRGLAARGSADTFVDICTYICTCVHIYIHIDIYIIYRYV